MRSRRNNDDRILVVGIFQSPETGRAVLKNLRRARFRRAAAIHASAEGRQRVKQCGVSAIGGATVAWTIGLVLGAVVFWQRGILADYRPGALALLLAVFALAGAVTSWIIVRLLQQQIWLDARVRSCPTKQW